MINNRYHKKKKILTRTALTAGAFRFYSLVLLFPRVPVFFARNSMSLRLKLSRIILPVTVVVTLTAVAVEF